MTAKKQRGRPADRERVRDTREGASPGDFSDPRVRWPADEWDDTEQPDTDVPHSRAGGRPAAGRRNHAPPDLSPDLSGFGDSAAGSKMDAESRSDDSIREEILADLEADDLCDATAIEVAVRDGAVVLEGTVPTRPMKRRAAEIANAASDVRTVDNRLRVD